MIAARGRAAVLLVIAAGATVPAPGIAAPSAVLEAGQSGQGGAPFRAPAGLAVALPDSFGDAAAELRVAGQGLPARRLAAAPESMD